MSDWVSGLGMEQPRRRRYRMSAPRCLEDTQRDKPADAVCWDGLVARPEHYWIEARRGRYCVFCGKANAEA